MRPSAAFLKAVHLFIYKNFQTTFPIPLFLFHFQPASSTSALIKILLSWLFLSLHEQTESTGS